MAKEFAAVMTAAGAPGHAIVGPTSPDGLGKVLKTDLADFAIVSLDSLVSSAKGDPEWMKRVPYVARLAPETLEVIAPREIKSINGLQGKLVSFGELNSATSTSGRMLFSRLGVTPNQTNSPLPEALDALAAGKVDAVVVLGAEGAPALDGFGGDGRFHIVAIPWSATLEPVYAPAHVTAAERPNLVGATTPVETVGEPMALVALDAPPGSPRADAARPAGAELLRQLRRLPGRRSRPSLARCQSRGRGHVARRAMAAAGGGAKLAGCEKGLGGRVSRRIPRLGQIRRRFAELAERQRFGSPL